VLLNLLDHLNDPLHSRASANNLAVVITLLESFQDEVDLAAKVTGRADSHLVRKESILIWLRVFRHHSSARACRSSCVKVVVGMLESA
jgi:hypothetical protein